MSVIDSIRADFSDKIIPCCDDNGCTLRLNDLNDYIIMKGERICIDRKMCDCIIFKNNNIIIIGIVELKSKNPHVNDIEEKLNNSSAKAIEIFEQYCERNIKFELCHIVLAKRWKPPEYDLIKSKKIRIRGKRYDIIPKKCGDSFSTLISSLLFR